ncbi:MAG: YdgA family protein [Vibrionaceae bacterium]|nr:YdgA family protein [Vibrionaceae bacterium]
MQNLKKLGAIGGAISLALCWPLAVGQIGQSIIEDSIANLNDEMIKGEVIEYQRGYLSSAVLTRYTVVDPELKTLLISDNVPTTFDVTSDVSHGLTSLTADSKLVDSDSVPLTLRSQTQLNGNTAFTLNLDSWHYRNEVEDLSVSTSPVKVSGNVTVLGDLNYQVSVPYVQVDFGNGDELHLNGLTGQGKGKQVKGYWLGEQAFSLEKLDVVDSAMTPVFLIENANYSGNTATDEAGEKLNSQFNLAAQTMRLTDGTDVDNFKLDFSIKDVDSQSFDHIMSIYQSSAVLSEQEINNLLPHIDTLFNKGFNLSVNELSLAFGEGTFHNEWELSVPQGTEQITQNPMKLVNVTNGALSTYFSDELVERYPFIQEGIDELLIMELIEKVEGGYQLKAQIGDGKLKFENGHEFPLIALLMPALMQK